MDESKTNWGASELASLAELQHQLMEKIESMTNQLVRVNKAIAALRGEEPSRGGDDEVRNHTGKYRALWQWLRRQNADVISATFGEIEEVIGFELPGSCRKHPPHWYGYEGSAVARAIRDAGFKARKVQIVEEMVEFCRLGVDDPSAS